MQGAYDVVVFNAILGHSVHFSKNCLEYPKYGYRTSKRTGGVGLGCTSNRYIRHLLPCSVVRDQFGSLGAHFSK